MPERRLRIGAFGQRQAADFFGQGKIGFRCVGGFGSGVQFHVILRKKVLAQIRAAGAEIFGRNHFFNHFIGQRFAGFVMFADFFEYLRVPGPTLQHLAGGFHKVPADAGAGLGRVTRFGQRIVQHMPKFMEQGADLAVF